MAAAEPGWVVQGAFVHVGLGCWDEGNVFVGGGLVVMVVKAIVVLMPAPEVGFFVWAPMI